MQCSLHWILVAHLHCTALALPATEERSALLTKFFVLMNTEQHFSPRMNQTYELCITYLSHNGIDIQRQALLTLAVPQPLDHTLPLWLPSLAVYSLYRSVF